ncbi:hypothetical protein [Dactylosporangium sp. NPDC006015]|uniref:hypothetical protein n=1 Tax=Dactylosporangium sp. NPDC006015 TaxID=3154576 RepID=UPI0033BE84CA
MTAGVGIREAHFGEPQVVHRERLGRYRVPAQYEGQPDSYFDSALFLNYDRNGRLLAIRISDFADVRWNGISLVGRPLGEVLSDMAGLGYHPDEFELESLMFSSLGIALSSPFIDDLEENVTGAAILPVSAPA